jgi:5'-phosphate synthase pdxT subunit
MHHHGLSGSQGKVFAAVMKIGVLALQGAFIEHTHILHKLGVSTSEVRLPSELEGLNGLIIPGGESTSILKIMHDFGLFQPLKVKAQSGLPIWGTCAGMICLARQVVNNGMTTLAVMDINVRRNAFGRQVDSFETELTVPILGQAPYHAVFIRAPIIESVGNAVKVLAKLPDGTPVAACQDRMLVTSFHPELTEDTRFHEFFLSMTK